MRLPTTTPLIVIGMQNALDDPENGQRNNPGAEENVALLLDSWRQAALPVIHIRHDSVEEDSPYHPSQAGHGFKPEALPDAGEAVIGKEGGSAFAGTALEALLEENGVTHLVLAGALTPHAVEATARHACDLGFQVFLVADASWACDVWDRNGWMWPAEDVHALSLAHLRDTSVRIVGTKMAAESALLAAALRARLLARRAG